MTDHQHGRCESKAANQRQKSDRASCQYPVPRRPRQTGGIIQAAIPAPVSTPIRKTVAPIAMRIGRIVSNSAPPHVNFTEMIIAVPLAVARPSNTMMSG
jgi:hypothetical protein